MLSESEQQSEERAGPSCPRILVFHKSVSQFSWGATNFAPRRMRGLLACLLGKGYRLASLSEAIAAPSDNKVAITFDDGYHHLKEVLPPLIDDFGLRPTVFVPTGLIGGDNDWDYSYRLVNCPHLDAEDIANLAGWGVEFGSHGVSHTALTRLSCDEVRSELDESRRRLGQLTGHEVAHLSYPFGRVNPEIAKACEQAGYRYGLTMRYPKPNDSNFTIGRMAVYGYDTPLAVLRKLTLQGWGYRLERREAAITSRLSGASVLLRSLRRRRSMPKSQ